MTYGVLDFLGLRQPGTEAELRDGGAGGQGEALLERHGGSR